MNKGFDIKGKTISALATVVLAGGTMFLGANHLMASETATVGTCSDLLGMPVASTSPCVISTFMSAEGEFDHPGDFIIESTGDIFATDDLVLRVGGDFVMQTDNLGTSTIEAIGHDITLNADGNVTIEKGSRIEVESQPSGGGLVEVSPAKDTFLRPGSKNKNEGANPYLILLESGIDRDVIMGYDLSAVNTSSITSAKIVLTIDDEGTMENWGSNGRHVSIHRLDENFTDWQEGNGAKVGLPPSEHLDGSGAGVTWLCPTDTNLSDNKTDCSTTWDGGIYDATPTDQILHTNGMVGTVEWDVTSDVLDGVDNWLIKRTQGGGYVRYFSKDHPDAELKGPKLVVEGGSGEEGVKGNISITAMGLVQVTGAEPIIDENDESEIPDPEKCSYFSISASPADGATDAPGGTVSILSTEGTFGFGIVLNGCALQAGKNSPGNTGGTINLRSEGGVLLVEGEPTLRAVGDYVPDDPGMPTAGIGKGGTINIQSTFSGVLWLDGFGDVRPTGTGDASIDGSVNLDTCFFAGSPEMFGVEFPDSDASTLSISTIPCTVIPD